MDRNVWKRVALTEDHIPPWPCPSCQIGALSPVKGSLTEEQTAASVRDDLRDGRDPFAYGARYTCLLKCSSCGDPVAVMGHAHYNEEYTSDGPILSKEYVPYFIEPPAGIIRIPRKCPEVLAATIRRAFSTFWFDSSATANAIRTAIDLLLTHRGIKRYSVNKGKRKLLYLHNRIELFAKNEPDLGNPMLAVKWIGNEGSHPGQLERDDLLDAFELLEYVLDEVIEKRRLSMAKLSKKIVARKGPRSRQRMKKGK